MLGNHFKTALRLFVRNKVYTIINLLGLSLALMICFLTYLYINDELSYDNFHKDSDRVFLINGIDYKKDVTRLEPGLFDSKPLDGISKSSVNNLPFLKLAETTIPEVESLVKIQAGYITLEKEGEELSELAQYVDENFFNVLDFHFLQGNPTRAMSDLKSAVVSDKFAMKYFGTLNVVGEYVTTKGTTDELFLISGVISSLENSIIDRNIFLRIENSPYLKNDFYKSWSFNAFGAFVKLNEPENLSQVANKLREIEVNNRWPNGLDERRELHNLGPDNPVVDYELKPISQIYLDPTITFGKSSSPIYSLILGGIAIIILIIACINYLAISITSSAARRSEIAIRKVIGANVFHLKAQFYAESLLQVIIAVLLGFTLTQALMPLFNDLANKEFELTLIENIRLLVIGFLFGLALTFFAGGYPAQILSRFRVVSGLKGSGSHKIKSKLIQGMVIFQFSICLMFISTGFVMHRQFEFVNNKQLGFDKEQVVYIEGVRGQTGLLKEELAKYPSVMGATGSRGIFVGRSTRGAEVVNGKEHFVNFVRIDTDFFGTLGMELIPYEGIPNIEQDQFKKGMSFMNQRLYEMLKEDTVKLNSYLKGTEGIVSDFHFESLQNAIGPLRIEIADPSDLSVLFVKLGPNQIEEGITAIRESYSKITEKPLKEVKFLDDFLNSRYQDSQKWQKIVNVSACFGILIASIGLFGLTGIGMANRMKELSIRKVLGAGHRDITFVLNRQTFVLILIAALISIPLSYYLMENWLSSFAYHVSITADLFGFAVALLLVITIITVTYHSLKVITSNPANILRNE